MDERDRRARLLGLRLRCIRLQRSLLIHRLAESKKTSKLYQRQLYRERKLRGEYVRVVLNLKEKDPAIFFEFFNTEDGKAIALDKFAARLMPEKHNNCFGAIRHEEVTATN